MGDFYLYRGNKLIFTGTCPDGDEVLQGNGEYTVGIGKPPKEIQPDNYIPPASYSMERAREYPSTEDQLDALWHAMDVGVLPKVAGFYEPIATVKARHPKTPRK